MIESMLAGRIDQPRSFLEDVVEPITYVGWERIDQPQSVLGEVVIGHAEVVDYRLTVPENPEYPENLVARMQCRLFLLLTTG